MDLNSEVSELPLVGPYYLKKLEKLGIKTLEDLLNHVPHRYLDFTKSSPISKTKVGDILTVKGEVASIKNQYTRSARKIQVAEISDETGSISAIWFNQPYIIRNIPAGTQISLSGKIDWFGRNKAFISPEYERIFPGKEELHTGRLVPVYPETSGLSSKWLRGRIKDALIKTSENIEEFLPGEILSKYDIPDLLTSFSFVHFPKTNDEAEKGKERLAFNELLLLQLAGLGRKIDWQKNQAVHKLSVDKKEVDNFIKKLPFILTVSQNLVIGEILRDLQKPYPMNRLLEGDVGSGKTVVAAVATFISFLNGYQTVFMAPTQILAQQHYQTLKKLFLPYKAKIELVISGIKKKDIGKTDIFIGTHALIHKNVSFENVALTVIDEQHKFGVEQRSRLVKKTKGQKVAPHVLTMTATPIPRTVALTFYGDLDLSTLTQMPPGRKPVTTWVVPPAKREKAYEWVREKIAKEKIQAFVVCPLIEESEVETLSSVKSVKKEFENLKKIFSEFSLGLLHGKLSAKEKESVVNKFKQGKHNLLVSTPVVEVGIDITNAAIMIIEGAERFGLASLHQLRGRVGRGSKKSYCLLFTESKGEKVITRLSAMQRNLSGFELSELDLKLRGPGELLGTRQHGFPELKIASWLDIGLIKKAKETAIKAFEKPKKYKKLFKKIKVVKEITN